MRTWPPQSAVGFDPSSLCCWPSSPSAAGLWWWRGTLARCVSPVGVCRPTSPGSGCWSRMPALLWALQTHTQRHKDEDDHMCHHPHRFNEFATKSGKRNGKPNCDVLMVDSHLQKLYTGNDWADSQVGKATISEDLKCWGAWDTTSGHTAKDITLSHSQGHHTINHLEEMCGKTRQSSMKGWERYHQLDEHGIVSRATLWKSLTDRVKHVRAFPHA